MTTGDDRTSVAHVGEQLPAGGVTVEHVARQVGELRTLVLQTLTIVKSLPDAISGLADRVGGVEARVADIETRMTDIEGRVLVVGRRQLIPGPRLAILFAIGGGVAMSLLVHVIERLIP